MIPKFETWYEVIKIKCSSIWMLSVWLWSPVMRELRGYHSCQYSEFSLSIELEKNVLSMVWYDYAMENALALFSVGRLISARLWNNNHSTQNLFVTRKRFLYRVLSTSKLSQYPDNIISVRRYVYMFNDSLLEAAKNIFVICRYQNKWKTAVNFIHKKWSYTLEHFNHCPVSWISIPGSLSSITFLYKLVKLIRKEDLSSFS